MKISVSIIIPVYNVEKYLDKCLSSIINQTFTNIEIICIDDGSKDTSLQILNGYEKSDSRIKIITKENGGQSSARNRGIEIAQGEYIAFIDSDDWVDEDYIEKLYNAALLAQADIAMSKLKLYYEDTKYFDENTWINSLINNIHSKQNNETKIKKDIIQTGIVCGKLFRTKMIKENALFFFEGLYWEDTAFIMMAGLISKQNTVVLDTYYFYRKHSSSTTNTGKNDRKSFDIFKIAENLKPFFIENEISKLIGFEYFYAEKVHGIISLMYDEGVHNQFKREFFYMMKLFFQTFTDNEKQYLCKKEKQFSIILNTSFMNFNIFRVTQYIMKTLKKLIKKIFPVYLIDMIKKQKEKQ